MNENSEVKLHFLDYWRVIKMRIGLILLTFFLVIVTAGVYVVFLPKEFYSKVTLDIKPDNNRGVDPLSFVGSGRADPQFISTQFQILRKSSVLEPVIEKLDLVKKLSPPGQQMPLSWVTRMLDRSMTVQEQRNTTLIEVGVYNVDRELAATIANTIATEYRDMRQAESSKNVETTLTEMRDELANKRREVAKYYEIAAKIRQEEEIIDPDPESSNVLISTSERPLQMTESTLVEQREKVDKIRNELTSIDKLNPGELMEALKTLEIQDPTVTNVLPQLHTAQAQEGSMLGAGLGENHPRVQSVRKQIEVYKKQLSDQLNTIRTSHRMTLSIEETQLKSKEDRFVELKKKHIADKDRTNRYVEAKANYLSAKNLLMAIEQRHGAARFEHVLTTNPVVIRERAVPGLSPEKPKIPTYMALAALIGLVVGVSLAFFIEYLDTSVKTIEDIERYLSLTVLAVIPKDISVLIKQKRDSADAEAYRILKANIEFNQTDRAANTFTLVSGGPGEGKSTTLNNLAYTFARGGANVLVVDADLRRPSQQRYFDVENDIGLSEYLQNKASLDEIVRTTKLDNLSFIPSGKLPQDDVGILNGSRMTDLIHKLKNQYDIVFFDSPPILGVSDASLLVSEVDNTIMVVQHRRFPRGMLQRVKQAVTHVGGNLIGVVLNNVDTRQDDSYSYYSSYNDYYAPRRERATPQKPVVAGNKADDGEY
jgi:succinoglycan biosynthesis transport protein ExoP